MCRKFFKDRQKVGEFVSIVKNFNCENIDCVWG